MSESITKGDVERKPSPTMITPDSPLSDDFVARSLDAALSKIQLVLMAIRGEQHHTRRDLSPIANGLDDASDTVSRALERVETGR